ncbi:MAG: type IV pilus assembly protein PilA [Verrucomicrobiales bacterium]|jgi:type IV pilus assembly protein PilA
MTKTNLTAKAKKGFSLVEMLVVIAVIGILAAIAVPQIGRINDAAGESKDRRNAQQLSSVVGAAQAAGLDFLGANTGATVAAAVTGATVTDTSSPFHGNYFGVPGLSSTEQTKALTYLSHANGMLTYLESATAP